MADEIETTVADHVCSITLNRPAKRNALTTAMIADLRAAVERAAAAPAVRVIVVRGAGAAFCAGLDPGAAATQELLFTGEPIGADAALGLGLVNRVVAAADLDAAVAALARRVAHNAPVAVRAMKAFVQRAADERRQWRRDDLEELERRVRESSDLREGLTAQRERRAPLFKGA